MPRRLTGAAPSAAATPPTLVGARHAAPKAQRGAPDVAAGQTVADMGEFGLIDVIAEMVPTHDPRVVVGIGDDAAAVRPTPGTLTLATCDIQVEGRHFLLDRISPRQLGRRSAAINLSDIGAMGGQPRYALISLALPKSTEVEWVRELYVGLREELARFETSVIGGNLSGSADGVVIDITLLGEVEQAHMVLRKGARPGDVVLVTGFLGSSTMGRLAMDAGLDRARPGLTRLVESHLTPTPRVREGQAVGRSRKATAMIDISDGLAGDLGHICEQSKAGARIFADRLPITHEALTVAAELGVDAVQAALHGGEDYELCVTCPPSEAAALMDAVRQSTGTAMTEIGVVTAGTGMTLLLRDGREEPISPKGWDHFGKGAAR